MKDYCFLIVGSNGVRDFRKREYNLKMGEIAIKLNLDIPDSVFENPLFEGDLKISERQARGKIIRELEFKLKRLEEQE